MSSSDQNGPQSPTGPTRRRSSFVDMFNPRSTSASQGQPPRRLSITTLGLSTLPGAQTSPFGNMRTRTESISSANSGSVDESPFEDENGSPGNGHPSPSVPNTPFARRMSFGAARTLRGNGNAQNGANANGAANEGFDFAESLRARAERSSISGAYGGFMNGQQNGQQPPPHQRAKSVAIMEPPKAEMPKQVSRPDAFQERILKGDFYMD